MVNVTIYSIHGSYGLGLGNWTFRMYYIIYIYILIHNYHLSLSGEGFIKHVQGHAIPESSYWGALQLPIAKDAGVTFWPTDQLMLFASTCLDIICVHIICINIIIHAKSGKPLRMKLSPFRVILGYTGIPLLYDDINRAPFYDWLLGQFMALGSQYSMYIMVYTYTYLK